MRVAKGAPKVADVLVIGAGASGSVAAKHLAESGFSVVCLEQGGRVENSEFWGDKPEWELMSQKRWHPNPNVRDLEQDYPVDTSDSDVNALMYNAVGGSTILYAAHWQRFMPSDFRVKTLDGVADDWPFTYEELEPFYDQMDLEMGVSGLGGAPAYPAGNAPPGGESFVDQISRTVAGLAALPSGDAVLVVHSGTIRAVLAIALDLAPDAALRFVIDPLSLTRIDRLERGWRVGAVNRRG